MPATDKLRDDPIVEALLDVRFAAPELQEVVVGRLSDIHIWRAHPKTRLPFAAIPEPLRAINPNLLFTPTIEIRGVAGIAAVRIGGNVLNLHFVHPYDGWDKIFPRIRDVIDAIFQVVPTLVVSRLGLRYINVFTTSRHDVNSVHDLNVSLHVGDTTIAGPMNVVFSSANETHTSQTRVASRDYLQGQLSKDAVAAADIDVSTPTQFSCSSAAEAKTWIDRAHDIEKQAFRRLLPDPLYNKLRSPLQ
jgi:uncharacterized protein (TIGR04255 family)